MSGSAPAPARDVYELVTRGMIVLVRDRATGVEVFRHIEDLSDADDHLLDYVQADLDQMNAAEFKARWVD